MQVICSVRPSILRRHAIRKLGPVVQNTLYERLTRDEDVRNGRRKAPLFSFKRHDTGGFVSARIVEPE